MLIWSMLSGIGGYIAVGIAAVLGFVAYGWRQRSQGRAEERVKVETQSNQEAADRAKTRLDVEQSVAGLGDDELRRRMRDRARPDV